MDGIIGTAVGAGLDGLAQVTLVAANVSLFIASPLLVMLGWGASIGDLLLGQPWVQQLVESGCPIG